MPQLVDVLAEVLRSFGYRATVDAQPAAGEPSFQVPLWAEKDERTVAVEFWYESEPPTASFLDGFQRFLDETRADQGILVSFGHGPDVANGDGRITVWGVDRVRALLGAAVLEETCPGLVEHADPLLNARPESDTEPEPDDESSYDAPEAAASFDMFDAAEPELSAEPAMEPDAAIASDGSAPDEPDADVSPVPAATAAETSDEEAMFEMLPGRDDEPEEPSAAETPGPGGDEKQFEMLPGPDDEAEEPPEAETAEPDTDEKPFEMLPGRDDEPEAPSDEPPAAEPPGDAEDDQPFEMLPGRADAPEDEPTATTGSADPMPGRPRDNRNVDAEAPAPSLSDAAAGTDFELLAGRAAAGSDEPTPEDSSAGGYDELPGRQEVDAAPASPAIPVNAEGRGYEELPGRHEAPPPEESAGSFDATGSEGRDFEVMDASPEEDTATEEPEPPQEAESQPSSEFQVPPAFSSEAAPGAPGVLRIEVGRKVAHNLVKDKIRRVREERLRLVPYLVFAYEADILVDGKLDAETKRGRVGVDAWMKRAQVWQHGTQTAPLEADGADVEQLKVRVDEDEARRIVLGHLEDLVGREVTEEQESDEWSVVVKRRVRLAEDDVRIRYEGTYWLPVWRLAGAEGSVEIDAAGGEVLDEEILVEHSDSQLL